VTQYSCRRANERPQGAFGQKKGGKVWRQVAEGQINLSGGKARLSFVNLERQDHYRPEVYIYEKRSIDSPYLGGGGGGGVGGGGGGGGGGGVLFGGGGGFLGGVVGLVGGGGGGGWVGGGGGWVCVGWVFGVVFGGVFCGVGGFGGLVHSNPPFALPTVFWKKCLRCTEETHWRKGHQVQPQSRNEKAEVFRNNGVTAGLETKVSQKLEDLREGMGG